ncbi:hypothetical protein WMF31_36775 [Sorangium sp. So ce1036]|uniref:beta-xylosidase family glycoside hydrolase n=1 Tax=Sorangium sp. So ce1036 TaxID=3133328 RepID=UPI003F07D0EB
MDTSSGAASGHEREWNHNPDETKWSLDTGLRLRTAIVTTDLCAARSTLSRRILGPSSTVTIELDHSAMRDGGAEAGRKLRRARAVRAQRRRVFLWSRRTDA